MISKIITTLSALLLLAVFILLFKFSIPQIREYFSKQETRDIVDIRITRFLNRISFEDSEVIIKLPCNIKVDRRLCENSERISKILNEEKSNSVISYLNLFSGNGVNLFDGTKLSQKYFSLIEKSKKNGEVTTIEKAFSDDAEFNIIYVKNISKVNEKSIFSNVYYVGIVNSSSLKTNYSIYFLVIGFSFVLPFLFILLYSLKTLGNAIISAKRYEGENEILLDQIENLKRENIQQSSFLTNFTHELRTPLNSIIGFSGLLKDQTLGQLGNSEYIKYSEDINNAGVHLLSLINDILDYTKAEVGRLKVNLTEVDIVKIIRQCLAIVAPRASESGVELMQSLTSDHLILRLDQKRIKQVILNLLSNAVKFTPEGGNVTVSVFPDVRGDRVYIEIKDTGVGIAEKDIPIVMSLFGQADTDLNRKYEGTGIGLPFSKKLTNMLGGTFELSSKLGSGTRVTLGFTFDKKLNVEFLEMVKG